MKLIAIFVLAFLVVPNTVFAKLDAVDYLVFANRSSNEPLPPEHAREVRKAVATRMRETNLSCSSAIEPKTPSDTGLESLLRWIESSDESVKVYVKPDNTQPLITMRNPCDTPSSRCVLVITTSADQKDLVEFTARQEKISIVRTNVGTILVPKWEEREVVTETAFDLTCRSVK